MKKVLSLVLAVMMVVGMTTVAFADDDADPVVGLTKVPSNWKITGFNEEWDGTWLPTSNIGDYDESIKKTDELKITADMFDWEYKEDGKTKKVAGDSLKDADVAGEGDVLKTATLRSSHLSSVGVRRTYQKGTNGTIKSVELKESKSLVEVKTVDYFVKTGSTDVELTIALTFKGKASDRITKTYDFTMKNKPEYIEEDQNEVYSHGNVVLEAEATTRNVEFEGDEDGIVYATKTVVKGQKYYFNVSSKLESEDELIIAENPEVDSIYNVRQVNMANATIEFKDLDREFFVYDGEGKLLGTTKDSKLPLASKYILTTAKVDFGGEEEPVEEPVEEPTEPEAPPMGGGEVPAPVNNYNPNTGL